MIVTSAPRAVGYIVILDGEVQPDSATLWVAAGYIARDYLRNGLRQTRVRALVKGRQERDLTADECAKLSEMTVRRVAECG